MSDHEDSSSNNNKPTMRGYEINTGARDEEHYDTTTRRAAFAPNTSAIRYAPAPVQQKHAPVASSPYTPYIPAAAETKIRVEQQEEQQPAEIFRWRLQDVPQLGEYHRVERTAVFVPHAAHDPSSVTSRISDVLRDRSIQAEYDDDKAKVKCITPDGVDFRIRLYRGRGDSYSHGIIVEVQRRFKTSLSFHQETRAILDAAQGKTDAAMTVAPPTLSRTTAGNTAPLPMVTNEDMLDSEDEAGSMPPPPSGAASLQMVHNMMQHRTPDTLYLALQTLLSLTDVNKMGVATARNVSMELLRPGNETGARVFGLLQQQQQEEGINDDVFHLRVMALTVLANALQATRGQQVDAEVVRQIRPVLLQELQRADTSPRSAQIAARCIEYVLSPSSDNAEVRSALEVARKAGEVRHVGLMRQAQVCLDAMMS